MAENLTKSQIDEIQSAFETFDKDHDGLITMEARLVLKNLKCFMFFIKACIFVGIFFRSSKSHNVCIMHVCLSLGPKFL